MPRVGTHVAMAVGGGGVGVLSSVQILLGVAVRVGR
jgi:hypothetical protein